MTSAIWRASSSDRLTSSQSSWYLLMTSLSFSALQYSWEDCFLALASSSAISMRVAMRSMICSSMVSICSLSSSVFGIVAPANRIGRPL